MHSASREVRPGPRPRQVVNEYGMLEEIPAGWALLPPGDAALSRRIKLDGPTLTVIERRGRKRFSRGIWAPQERIAALRAALAAERADPAYARRLESGRRRRAAQEEVYVGDFHRAVVDFLDFHPAHQHVARALASLITAHATPVGSGTVARTERIPIGERAQAATIAWMRHETTGYDRMQIPRVAGRRREVRRLLAQRSVQLLEKYRSGAPIDIAQCPLQRRLAGQVPARTIG